MKKLSVFLSLLALMFVVNPIFALELTQVGSYVVPDQSYTSITVSSQNPVLAGTAAAGSAVNITIGSESFGTTADGTGYWAFQPTTMTTGSYSVAIADALESMNLTISVGGATTTTTTASGSAQTLPVSGAVENTLMLAGAGALCIVVGWKLSKRD